MAGAAVALAAGGLAVAAPDGSAAARPDLRPLAVSAAAGAAPGGLLPVRVVMAPSGAPSARPAVAIYLSADAKRSKDDVRLVPATRLPQPSARRQRTVPVGVQLPTTQAVGTRRVIACVDDPGRIRERDEHNNCRPARGALTIAEPSTAAAPAARIAADAAAGKLSATKAIEYRVLARFGDPKLPAQYAGDPGDAEDDGAMRDAASHWADLPRDTRRAIGKYFLPPPVRQALESDPSALVRGKSGKSSRKAARLEDAATDAADEQAAPEVCGSEYTRVKTWDNVSAAGGKVRLHWERSKPEDGAKAKALVGDVTRAYARYKQMLGSEPLSDANVGCYHGPDGALDIYVTPVWYKAGVTVPSAQSDQHEAACEGYPGFIAADPDHPRFRLGYTIAHELFHAFQMAYRYKAGCEDAAWLDEGSATWAGHLIYPADNAEHTFHYTLMFPHGSIESAYHAWVFFLWMHERFGDAAIRTTYATLKTADSTTAVDRGIGTFRAQFLDFAKAGWNQAPDASFVTWDGLATVPHVTEAFPSGPVVPVNFHLAGQKQRTAYSQFGLRALGRDYKRYPITDEKLRSLTFKNPLAGNPNAKIGAYLTLASGEVRWEDWSGKEQVKLCRDQPAQDVRDIILVYANATPAAEFSAADVPITATPEWALKDSCEEELPWHYEVLWGQLTSHVEGHRPGNASDGLCVLNGFETRDKVDFVGAADGTGYRADANTFARTDGTELEGDFEITAPKPTRSHVLDGCKGWDDSGPKTECHTTHSDDMGPFTIGFRMTAESRQAQVATLRWGIPPAIAGFVDADDSVCNVGTLDHHLDDPEMYESDVLMTDLAGSKPFTVTLSGDWSWTGPADLGDKGTLTYSYEAKMRLQRVNADGSPL